MTPDSPIATSRIQARNFRIVEGRPIEWICLHSTESQPGVGARNIASWWAGPSSPETSAHFVLDSMECIQLVSEGDVAYAAGHMGNTYGIHVECCGRASMTLEEWFEHPGEIELAARLVADLCSRHDIPCVLLDAAALVGEDRGVTTHAAISAAFHQSDHSDPGQAFAEEIVRRTALYMPAK